MSYATAADLESRIGRNELIMLAPHESDQDDYNAQKVSSALEDASAEIDSYLSVLLSKLEDPSPSILVRRCCDLARYYLMDDRPTEQAEKRYDDAVSFLESAAKGDINLGAYKSATLGNTPINAAGTKKRSDRVFTRDTMAGY